MNLHYSSTPVYRYFFFPHEGHRLCCSRETTLSSVVNWSFSGGEEVNVTWNPIRMQKRICATVNIYYKQRARTRTGRFTVCKGLPHKVKAINDVLSIYIWLLLQDVYFFLCINGVEKRWVWKEYISHRNIFIAQMIL